MTIEFSAHQTRLLRLASQRLLPLEEAPPDSPAQAVRAVVAIQAQDLPSARLSIRPRSAGLTASQVDQARQVEGSLIWTWCLRGTLHLVAVEDARWLSPFLRPTLISAHRRRFEQLGWDAARAETGIRLLRDALEEHGELTRGEVVRLLREHGLPSEGQAPFHLIYRVAVEGILCPGPDRGKEPAYRLFAAWVGEQQPLPHSEALAELALRYLRAYGPATPEDFASWSGIKIGDARQAWRLVAGQIVEVQAAGQPAWLLKEQLPRLEAALSTDAVVRLLPRFDTYLLGYANRSLAVAPPHARRIHPGGGIINAALLVDGQARGVWQAKRLKSRYEIHIDPFEPIPPDLLPLLEAEAGDLGRFLETTAVLSIDG